MKPRLFICSSKEGIDIANACHQNLGRDAEVTIWSQGIFELSPDVVDSLIRIVDACDFAMFVLSADDLVISRGDENQAARDNVIFELGVFVGHLGKERCFLLLPQGNPDLRLPTDIIGMTPVKYETDRTDGNLQAATGSACTSMRLVMKKIGVCHIEQDDPDSGRKLAVTRDANIIMQPDKAIPGKRTGTEAVITEPGYWVRSFFEKDYSQTVKLLETEIESVKTNADDMAELSFLESYNALSKYRNDPSIGWQVFRELISKYPKQVHPYTLFSQEQFSNNLPKKSLDTLEKGIFEVEVENRYILINAKAERLIQIGLDEDAISVLHEGILKYPNKGIFCVTLSNYYIDSEEYALARSCLEGGLSKIPDDSSLLSLYAKLLYKNIDIKLSLIPYNRLVTLFPENYEFLTLRANVYLDLELHGLAMRDYKKANELAKEKEAWILANIGNLYKNRGFYIDSIEYFKLALEIDPESQYTHERLATSIKYRDEQVEKLSQIIKEARRDISHPQAAEDNKS